MIVIAATVILLLVGVYLHSDYKKNVVVIEELGGLWLPDGWVCEASDGIFRVTASENPDHVYMIGTLDPDVNLVSVMYAGETLNEDEMRDQHSTMYMVLSNSAMIGECEYVIHGETVVKKYMDLLTESPYKDARFLIWDENVSRDTVEKIAKSHKRSLA